MKKLLYIPLLLCGLASCRDDCPEPDPCADYPEKMEILIEQYNLDPVDKLENEFVVIQDTILFASPYKFKTNYDYDSIVWQFGTDPTLRKGEKVFIQFYTNVIGTTVKITAVCHRAINRDCFGDNDDGIDTLTKNIHFRATTESPLLGVWRGTNDGESDSFDVSILPYFNTLVTRHDHNYYTGLPKGTVSNPKGQTIVNDWDTFYGRSGGGLDENNIDLYHLNGSIQKNGTLVIHWRIWPSKVERTFTGTKIN